MSAAAFGDAREPGHGLRWTMAAVLMAGVHVGAGWWLVTQSFAAPPALEGAPGVTVELEPIAVPVPLTADPRPVQDAGPGPTPQVAEIPDVRPEPLLSAETAVAPPPEPAPAPQAKPEPVSPPPAPTPEVVPAPLPDVVSPPAPESSDAVLTPPPRPAPPQARKAVKPPKPIPPKPDPREIVREETHEAQAEARQQAREQARREARAQAAAEARAQRQAARAQARAARAAAIRKGGGADHESAAPMASGEAVSSWRGEVLAHLNAYKPASPDGASGTVRIGFTVDRGGRVTSASVAGSSGDAALDQAALSMVRRASPVPAPPPEMGGRISLGVPVHFQ